MKSLIPFLVAIIALGAGAMYLVSDLQERLTEAEFNTEIEKQRVIFAQESALSRSVANEQFPQEKSKLINWHSAAIDRILSRYPQFKDEDAFIHKMEKSVKDGKKKQKSAAKISERYDWLKKTWESTLKNGSNKSLLSQYKSGIRYEVLNFSPFKNVKGEKSLRMDLLLWGPIKDQIVFTGIDIQFIRNEGKTSKSGKITHKKSLAKVSGGGAPNVLHPAGPNPEPSRWILGWPPGVMAGYYYGLPLFPEDAEVFDLKLSVQIRSRGGKTTPIEFKWTNISIKPEWKLGANQKWEAETTTGSDEELKAAGIK